MIFYWVCNRVRQGHYLVYWERGKDDLDYYFTKNDPNKHYCDTRGTYLVTTDNSSKHVWNQVPSNMQGCVKPPPPPPCCNQETGNRRKMSPSPTNVQRTDRDGQATRFRRRIRKYIKPYGNLYSNSDVCPRTTPTRLLATLEVPITSPVLSLEALSIQPRVPYLLCPNCQIIRLCMV